MKKQFIIIGIVVLLVFVGLSGCFETNHENNNKDTNNGNNNQPENVEPDDDSSQNGEVEYYETIPISGVSITQTVNKPNVSVILIVSGNYNNITVTKETNLKQVILSGVSNIIRVSRSHSFASTVSGVGSEIVYYD